MESTCEVSGTWRGGAVNRVAGRRQIRRSRAAFASSSDRRRSGVHSLAQRSRRTEVCDPRWLNSRPAWFRRLRSECPGFGERTTSMTRSTWFDRSKGRRRIASSRANARPGRASRTSSSSRRVVFCSNTPRRSAHEVPATTHGGAKPGRRHSPQCVPGRGRQGRRRAVDHSRRLTRLVRRQPGGVTHRHAGPRGLTNRGTVQDP
jgi:hypothetical protein